MSSDFNYRIDFEEINPGNSGYILGDGDPFGSAPQIGDCTPKQLLTHNIIQFTCFFSMDMSEPSVTTIILSGDATGTLSGFTGVGPPEGFPAPPLSVDYNSFDNTTVVILDGILFFGSGTIELHFFNVGEESNEVHGFKIWDGSAWVMKPVKIWDGSQWVLKPVKIWDGSQWMLS